MKHLALGVAAAALLGLGGCAHHQEHMRHMEQEQAGECPQQQGQASGEHQHGADCPMQQPPPQ